MPGYLLKEEEIYHFTKNHHRENMYLTCTLYIKRGDEDKLWQLHVTIQIIKQPLFIKLSFPFTEVSSSYYQRSKIFQWLRKVRELLRGYPSHNPCAMNGIIICKVQGNFRYRDC
jgi:hypothetical protein